MSFGNWLFLAQRLKTVLIGPTSAVEPALIN